MPHQSRLPESIRRTPDRRLRILVADGAAADGRTYHDAIAPLGHEVLTADGGRPVIELCRSLRPDLLIADALPPGLDVPAIVATDRPPDESAASRVLAYLAKPIAPAALRAAVAVAARLKGLEEEVADLRRELEDRKLIERAKGVLMRYTGLSEEDAYERMRKLASHKNRKLVDVAQAVIAAGQVFRSLERPDEAGTSP